MSISQRLLAATVATVAWATIGAAPVWAQTPSLEAAIALYTSASYDEALVALEASRQLPLSPADRVELERHQMLCLLALGRTAEAVEAATRLLEQRPDYVLSEVDASPRVRALLETARRRVVPGMIRRMYEDGKRAFDAGEYGRAREVFTQLGEWLADTHVAAADPSLADLRTLSDGFLELSILGAARHAVEPVAPEVPTALLAATHLELSWAAAHAVEPVAPEAPTALLEAAHLELPRAASRAVEPVVPEAPTALLEAAHLELPWAAAHAVEPVVPEAPTALLEAAHLELPWAAAHAVEPVVPEAPTALLEAAHLELPWAAAHAVEPVVPEAPTALLEAAHLELPWAASPAVEPVVPEVTTALLAATHLELPWSAVAAVRMDPASISLLAEDADDVPVADAARGAVLSEYDSSGEGVIPVPPEPVVSSVSSVAAAGSAPTSTVPPPFAPLEFFSFDARDKDVVPPRAVSQEISGWWGAKGEPPAGTPLGAVELVIDHAGRVVEASIHKSVNSDYDAVLLESAKQWRYRPATRSGRPVRYRRIEPAVSASTLAASGAAATSAVPPPFAPLTFFHFDASDKDVVPPKAVSQEISGGWGREGEPPAGTLLGVVDLVIDAAGRVVEARIHQSVNHVYDAVLLESAEQWRYQPATRSGRPVRYRRIEPAVAASTLAASGAAATSAAPPPFAPLTFFHFDASDKDVVPPKAVSQEISGWWGREGEPAAGTLLGVVDLVIDTAGRVVEARIDQSVNRVYDAVLLESAKQWRYQPATRSGRPVRYRRISNVVSVREHDRIVAATDRQ